MGPDVEFEFDESVIDELTNGECWALAAILHERTGLPFAAIHGDGEIVHVGVELPDNMVVDIEGIWESAAWETRWVDNLQDVWEVYAGFVPDDFEDKDALLGYTPSREMQCYGFDGEKLGTIADTIVEGIAAYEGA